MDIVKQLADMPDEVRESAWSLSHKWYVRPARWIDDALMWMTWFAVGFAWWVPAYWILIANLPIDSITDGIPKVRNFIAWTYLATAVSAITHHWYSLQMNLPRKGARRTVLIDDLFPREVIRRLSYHVLGFGVLLSLACAMKSHGSKSFFDHLWCAAAINILGGSLFYYAWRPPRYGLLVPTESEVHASHGLREQRLLTPPSAQEDYATPIEKRAAALKFSDIFGMADIKGKLMEPARRIVATQNGQEPPPNGILLHGEPGNGKTIFAEALAGELEVPFIELTYGAVSSKWVGEMPRVIANCFAYARKNAPCVLLIDEIDSFIRSRDEHSNNSEDLKVTNTLLTEIVSLRRHKVILVAATNFLEKLDAAAIREGRFDYKIEITPPDEEARIGLLTQGSRKYCPHLTIEPTATLSVARRWQGFSASRLVAIVKAMPEYARERNLVAIGYADWIAVLRSVQGKKGRLPENAKSLNDLVLEGSTREALSMIASRLKDAHRIEALGGSLPSGILFYGPSGTGKTAAARALAKECGWSFLTVAGPELIADRDRLPKLYAEAKDIRPTLIFIDEAEDALRSRQFSATPDVTNRLLVLLDGVADRVRDVIFIAATNHPEQIDPALLRAGRLTEKVEFTPPPQAHVPGFIQTWLEQKGVVLAPDLNCEHVADVLEGETIANVEGVLQYALNRAIELRRPGGLVLTGSDISSALCVVSPERRG